MSPVKLIPPQFLRVSVDIRRRKHPLYPVRNLVMCGATVVTRLVVATRAMPLAPPPPSSARLQSELMWITKNLLTPSLKTVVNPTCLFSGMAPLPVRVSMWSLKLS